jgi:hypothetical protein
VSVTNPHFAWLPPEVNSALIFSGPGPGPLLAAAEAWDGLAGELASSASSFSSVTSDLARSSWQGASSAAMMTVASQYTSWLSAAAAQAEQVSHQASAIAAAFETALAATVQPAVVAANRSLVQALASTNWLGQNTPAIADIEAAYEQMWASDVAAMFGYHADASAAVARMQPWQQVLTDLGFHFSSGGQLTFGSPAVTASTQPLMLGPGTAGFFHGGPVTPASGLLNSPAAATGGLGSGPVLTQSVLPNSPLTGPTDPSILAAHIQPTAPPGPSQ